MSADFFEALPVTTFLDWVSLSPGDRGQGRHGGAVGPLAPPVGDSQNPGIDQGEIASSAVNTQVSHPHDPV